MNEHDAPAIQSSAEPALPPSEAPIEVPAPNPKPRYQMTVEWRDIESVTPYIRNAKKHPTKQIDKIAGSSAEFGIDQPIVVDAQGVIIKGHGRREAWMRLGIKQVPVVVRTDLSDAQVRAARIADNKSAESDMDDEMLALEMRDLKTAEYDLAQTGFDEREIISFLASSEPPPEVDPDAIPEKVETRCKPGEIWQLGRHRLLCGDSTKAEDVARLMNGEQADMVFTDPPYGVDMIAKNRLLNAGTGQTRLTSPIHGDDLSVTELKPMIEAAFRNIESILAPKSSYYIASPQGGELGLMMMMMMMQESGIPCRHMIVWVKNVPVFSMGRLDYDYQHEPLLYGWSKKRTHYFAGGGEFQKSVWHIDREPNKLHPTMKPVKIIENAILNSTDRDMRVADLFLGSGSTLIACETTGRRGFGIEIAPEYCDVILKRWEDLTGKQAVLLESAPAVKTDSTTPADSVQSDPQS